MRVNFISQDPNCGMLYAEYLMLDQLLSCQEPATRTRFTENRKTEVHDENLFITTHQAYEIWFKQIITELDLVRRLLNVDFVDEANMLNISSTLDRIKLIIKLLVEQFSILETMTPLDFMEFRDYLAPASGFQSYQFRMIENKLGIENKNRINYKNDQAKQPYLEVFKDPKCIEAIEKSAREPSLFELIQRWLERTPGLEADGFDFRSKYETAVRGMLNEDLEKGNELINNSLKLQQISQEESETKLKHWEGEVKLRLLKFQTMFNKRDFDQVPKVNSFPRLSYEAMLGALMISLYRDEPRFNQPYQLLQTLMDIDSLLMKWRNNHAQMVLKMIGSDTLGTGGSSGYHYLRATLGTKYSIFLDLCNISTYLIPKCKIPKLTPSMKQRLSIIEDLM